MPVTGFEPVLRCRNCHLKTARLPIPPHGPWLIGTGQCSRIGGPIKRVRGRGSLRGVPQTSTSEPVTTTAIMVPGILRRRKGIPGGVSNHRSRTVMFVLL